MKKIIYIYTTKRIRKISIPCNKFTIQFSESSEKEMMERNDISRLSKSKKTSLRGNSSPREDESS